MFGDNMPQIRTQNPRRTDFLVRMAGIAFVLSGIYILFSQTRHNPLVLTGVYCAVMFGLLLSPMAYSHPKGFPKFLIIISTLVAIVGYSTLVHRDKTPELTVRKFCDDDPDSKTCIRPQK